MLALDVVVYVEHLADPRPDRAGCAQLGDGGELLVGGGEAELDQLCGVGGGNACSVELAQQIETCGSGIRKLEDLARAGVVSWWLLLAPVIGFAGFVVPVPFGILAGMALSVAPMIVVGARLMQRASARVRREELAAS